MGCRMESRKGWSGGRSNIAVMGLDLENNYI